MFKSFTKGVTFFLGFFATAVFAYTVSGTVKTWSAGESLTAADLNTTVQSLKTAVENAAQMGTVQTVANPSAGTYYTPLLVVNNFLTVEPQIPMNRAGTVKNARVTITTNSTATACTVTLRKNATDTAILFTIPAGGTAAVTDGDTVSYVANDVLTWKTTCGTSSTNAMTAFISFEF